MAEAGQEAAMMDLRGDPLLLRSNLAGVNMTVVTSGVCVT